MTAIAIIPARGGSKGIPGKNLRMVGGMSLIRRCVETCNLAGCFDAVVVSTDCEEIRREVYDAGAELVERPSWLAGDECRSDPVLLHALMEYMRCRDELPDVTAFVQCTAPLMTVQDVQACVVSHRRSSADLTVQVVESHAIFADEVTAVSPRRQERPTRLEVAGTIWAMNTQRFLERGTVYGGSMQYHITTTRKLDIDTESDLRLAEVLLSQRRETPDVPVPEWYEYVGME